MLHARSQLSRQDELDAAKKRAGATVKAAVEFADASPPPPASLAKVN